MLAQAIVSPPQENQAENSARHSSFYAAMRIMPLAQRDAMYEVYRFCRAVDDIADDTQESVEARLAALQQWRKDISRLFAGQPVASLQGLAAAVSSFDLCREDFMAVIGGMEMDVRWPMQAPSEAELALYCDRVACAVGRLSVRIFGMRKQDGLDLAHHLGMALQLTNILRDIDEDGAMGRLYLPRELLDEANVKSRLPAEALADPAIVGACLRLAARAGMHFHQADSIMARYEPTMARAPRIMSQAYQIIYAALLKRGFDHPRQAIKINKARFGIILAKHMLS